MNWNVRASAVLLTVAIALTGCYSAEAGTLASTGPTATTPPTTSEPEWTLTERVEVVRSVPAEVSATASVPSFPDYPNATSTIAQFVDDQFEPWIAYAREAEIPSGDQGGSYELTPTVTLTSPRLISVEFDYYEYLCCRPYPNHGTVAVVLDPVGGEILGDEDIVDLTRLDEVEEVWLASFPASDHFGEEISAADWFVSLGESPRWSAISVADDGLFFATDRSGAFPGTTTHVPFEDLGDLVMPRVIDALA